MKRLGLLVMFLAACGTEDSGSLLTSGMSALVGARADGSGNTTVYAEIFAGNPDQLIFVDLTGNDELLAVHGSTATPMVETQVLTIVEHDATFPIDTQGEQFSVDFKRTIDAGAPMSTMALPSQYTLGTLPASQSRAQDMTITWSPAGDADHVTWKIEGSCILTATGSTGDTGSLTVPASTLGKAGGSNVPDTCSATLTLSRDLNGILDSHFGKGGSAIGSQIRTGMFTTTL